MSVQSYRDQLRAQPCVKSAFPRFEPHPLLRDRTSQTIVGRYIGGERLTLPAAPHRGCVAGRRPAARSGIDSLGRGSPDAGCGPGAWAGRLCRRELYGAESASCSCGWVSGSCGSTCAALAMDSVLARQIYHAGRSDDLRQVVRWLHARIDGSPIALIGFSLGANLVLKAGIEAADEPLDGLDCLLAANAPIDLVHCAAKMRPAENRVYNWNFVRWLRAMVDRLHRRFPELGPPGLEGVRTLYEFDDRYTAPRAGFASADDYYTRCSVKASSGASHCPGSWSMPWMIHSSAPSHS